MENVRKKSEKRDSAPTTIQLHDLPPRDNAVGGFNRAYSKLDLLDRDGNSMEANSPGDTNWKISLLRFWGLAILGVTGALFCGFIASLVVEGWLVSLALLLGGSAGVILASLFWAAY